MARPMVPEEVCVAKGLKFSVEGGPEFTDSTLNSTSYYVPGQGFVTSKECLEA